MLIIHFEPILRCFSQVIHLQEKTMHVMHGLNMCTLRSLLGLKVLSNLARPNAVHHPHLSVPKSMYLNYFLRELLGFLF